MSYYHQIQNLFKIGLYLCGIMEKSKDCIMRCRYYILIIVVMLPLLAMRDFTPDNELRYLSIADEALRHGTLFAFSNHGVPYADKPPLYLWLVMLAKWLLGSNQAWLLGLFSLVPALVIVETMNRMVAPVMTASHRLTASLMLMGCGLFTAMAVIDRMDMLMCMFIVLAVGEVCRLVINPHGHKPRPVVFAVYVFLALFTKGPVGLLVPMVSTLVFLLATGRRQLMPAFFGLKVWTVILGFSALWLFLAYVDGGRNYIYNMVVRQTMGRAMHSFVHQRPAYYYLLTYWYAFAPWSLLVAVVLVQQARHRMRMQAVQQLFAIVGACTLAMLSVFSSKLAVYMLPICPFAVYYAAMALPQMAGSRLARVAMCVPAAVLGLAPVAVLVMWCGGWCDEMALPLLPPALSLGIAGIIAMVFLLRAHELQQSIRTLSVGLIGAVALLPVAMPRLNADIGYGQLCREAKAMKCHYGVTNYYTWRIKRPGNMDVYLHRNVIPLGDTLTSSPANGVLMLKQKHMSQLPPHLAAAPRRLVGSKYAVVLLKKKK